MKISAFAKEVTLAEGLKVSITIAQVLEVLKIVNHIMAGELYKWIRKQ